MTNDSSAVSPLGRREFLQTTSGASVASLLASGLIGSARAQVPTPAPALGKTRTGLNVLFVFTDQERYHSRWPRGLSLPGHERLQNSGVTFRNHYCPATMCTSSRAVLMTGLQTPDNGMFENCDVPWMRDLPTTNPTIGHMLRKAGYYTTYQGKWHLSREFETKRIERVLSAEMEKYGFADCLSPGDLIGHTLGGYAHDPITASSAINWLRTKGRVLADDGKPWCMYVSFVNPHDVMYFNTDGPGEKVQDSGKLLQHAARAPRNSLYNATWDVPIPANLRQPFDQPGRPKAHGEFDKVWDYVLGNVPLEDVRWKRFNDYYINCIRDVDRSIETLLAELEALGLAENTIVIFTADHGKMAGAHGLRGKGPFVYEETNHLPLTVVHPDVKGAQECASLTSHIDLVPTLLSMAGVAAGRAAEIVGRALPGKDLSPLLASPGRQPVDAARSGVLFTYSGLMTNDAGSFAFGLAAKAAGKNPMEEAKRQGFRPDLKKRGSVRSAFDGRHKFTRYFSPMERNSPTTLDELFRLNDVELFDLSTDPGEMTNLAADRTRNPDLILAMNGKLEALIKNEIGKDDGREMPNIDNIAWGVDKVDL